MLFLCRCGHQTAVFVKDHRNDAEARKFCDLVQLGLLRERAEQREGDALFPGAARAADAVDIVFVLLGDVIVDACGSAVSKKDNIHLYWKLSKYQKAIHDYVTSHKEDWRFSSINESLKYLLMVV